VFKGITKVSGPNYVGDEGEFELLDDGELVAVLRPQVRTYQVQTEPMTEAAIDSNILRDVFVALGEPLGEGAWSVRLRVKPLIGFIWFGSGLMALGGFIAIFDRRYRVAVQRAERAAAQPAAGTA
jgi:cytochrome c-type biogenesis protein CcmF